MNQDDPDYNNYIGLRHLSPEMVRRLRAGLDHGAKPESLSRKLKKERKLMADDDIALNLINLTEGAMRFMVRNPDAGIVRWTEGEQFVFVEMDSQ